MVVIDNTYLPGECADIVHKGEAIGMIGVLHPEVLSKFDLTLPTAAVELNVEKIFPTPLGSITHLIE